LANFPAHLIRTTDSTDHPSRIILLDQRKLPFAPPFLDQLFAGNRAFDGVVALDVDKPRLCEISDMARTRALAVLIYPRERICGNTDIHSAAIAVCHDVDPAAVLHRQSIAAAAEEEKPSPVSSTG
jgi:hypothetical protein